MEKNYNGKFVDALNFLCVYIDYYFVFYFFQQSITNFKQLYLRHLVNNCAILLQNLHSRTVQHQVQTLMKDISDLIFVMCD